MATIGTLTANLELQSAAFIRGLDRASQALRSQTARMRQQTRIIERSFRDIRRSVDIVRAGFATLGAGLLVRNIVGATTTLERINNTLRVGAGDAEGAARAYAFVRDEAQRLGLDLRTAAEQFGSLSAAARGTALQGEATREIFSAVAEAMTALGRSAEQTGGAITAIEQIISKGTVSAEELRGQLGERLPGAFQIAARSIGVTTQELDRMLRQGQVVAEDFLPQFAAELRRAFGPEAEQAAQGLQASLNRLNTAVFEFTTQVGQGGVADAISDFARGLSEAARGGENLARNLGAGLGAAIRALGNAFLFAARHAREIAAAVAAFAAFRAAALIASVATAAFQLANALRLAALGMVALNVAMAKNIVIKLAQALIAAGAAIATYLALTEDSAAETEELTRQLGELEEQLSGAGGAGGVAGAADEAADAIERMLEQARRENQQLLALRAAHQGYGSTVENVNIAIAIDNQLRAAKITRLQAEKAGLLEVMVANERLRREIEQIIDAQEEQARAAQEAADAQRREQERMADLLLEPFRNFIQSAQSSLADFFEEVFSGGVNSFKDLFDEAKRLAIRFASELAALLVFRPQLLFGAAGGAAVGAAGAAPSLASSLGFGGLTAGINRFGAGIGFAPGGPGITNGIVTGMSGVPLAGSTLTSATLSQVLGVAGLGALGGSLVGSFFGGHGGIGGGIGGGLGAGLGMFLAAGTALGGPLGALIGGGLGAIAGGLLGSMFGGGSNEATGALRFASTAEGFGPFGGFKIGGENTFRAPLTNLIRQFDEGVAGFLNARTEALIAQRLQALPQFNERFPESDPSAGFRQILQQRARVVLETAGLRADTILAGAGSAEDIAQRVQEALQLQRTIGELTGEINRFDVELLDLAEQFEDAARKAEAFGISTAGLAEAQARATAEMQRRQQAELDAMALSVIAPFERLAQPLRAFQTQLEFSLLNPAEQAARAAADFRRLAAEAEQGSAVAIEQLVGAGQLFIEQAGRFGASPAQVAAIQEVQGVLANALNQLGQAQEQASAGIEDLLEQIRRGTDRLPQLIEEVRNVVAEIDKLRRDMA